MSHFLSQIRKTCPTSEISDPTEVWAAAYIYIPTWNLNPPQRPITKPGIGTISSLTQAKSELPSDWLEIKCFGKGTWYGNYYSNLHCFSETKFTLGLQGPSSVSTTQQYLLALGSFLEQKRRTLFLILKLQGWFLSGWTASRHCLTRAGEVLGFPVFGSLWVIWCWSRGRADIVLCDPPKRNTDGKKRADTLTPRGRAYYGTDPSTSIKPWPQWTPNVGFQDLVCICWPNMMIFA